MASALPENAVMYHMYNSEYHQSLSLLSANDVVSYCYFSISSTFSFSALAALVSTWVSLTFNFLVLWINCLTPAWLLGHQCYLFPLWAILCPVLDPLISNVYFGMLPTMILSGSSILSLIFSFFLLTFKVLVFVLTVLPPVFSLFLYSFTSSIVSIITCSVPDRYPHGISSSNLRQFYSTRLSFMRYYPRKPCIPWTIDALDSV